jgi:putative toxin-antitoxin system antitoxin component (TIGR02293 family)
MVPNRNVGYTWSMSTGGSKTPRNSRQVRTGRSSTGRTTGGRAVDGRSGDARSGKGRAASSRGSSRASGSRSTARAARPIRKSRPSSAQVLEKLTEPTWGPSARTKFLLETLAGVTELAKLLGVAKSQPTRWKQGSEKPSPSVARRLADLEHVWVRALQLWDAGTARIWLESPNAFLDHARPIDVLELRGAGEVLDALDAAYSGAYA